MTRFASSEDQGYRNIRDQLRIWAIEIQSEANASPAQQPFGRGQQLGSALSGGSSHLYSSSVNANGGQLIQGNVTLVVPLPTLTWDTTGIESSDDDHGKIDISI